MAGALELNLDGLIGPTHHYAGLASGNLASRAHAGSESSPRGAALQGLGKMKRLMEMGVEQAVLPPLDRPDWGFLAGMGFGVEFGASGESGESGAEALGLEERARVLARAGREAPAVLAAAFSASAMWAANAATVCPSGDSGDGRVHFTPANLVSSLHRSIESAQTGALLRAIFAGERFVHHAALPASMRVRDEGAANHMRFWGKAGRGVQVFVYGAEGEDTGGVGGEVCAKPQAGVGGFGGLGAERAKPRAAGGDAGEGSGSGPGGGPGGFVGRQTLGASRAVARLHGLEAGRALFWRQSQAAIDAGVFHNDVIAVSHGGLLLMHEHAFAAGSADVAELRRLVREVCGVELRVVEVRESEVSLAEAVATYFFNSQIVTRGAGTGGAGAEGPGGARTVMICPEECRRSERVRGFAEGLVRSGAVDELEFVEVRESMKNGGGPACLRLRVMLTGAELAAMHQGVRMTPELYESLTDWVTRHYRERLHVSDLTDVALADESRSALTELTSILGLGKVYGFQK